MELRDRDALIATMVQNIADLKTQKEKDVADKAILLEALERERQKVKTPEAEPAPIRFTRRPGRPIFG